MASCRLHVAAVWLLVGAACGSDAVTPEPLSVVLCQRDDQCDNGLFCDGVEACIEGICVLGAPPVCDDGIACTDDSCSNSLLACEYKVRDADGDGHGDESCVDADNQPLGDDCDDNDPARFPGNTEICDEEGRDEDCDDSTFGFLDNDGDTHVSSGCCNGTNCGPDCDDLRTSVGPGGVEVCDNLDNDCDGTTDEGVAASLFVDADGDGFGSTPVSACAGAAHTSVLSNDCDDADPSRHPGQIEVCDGKDNDCDPNADEGAQAVNWWPDTDQDGYGDPNGDPIFACIPPANHSVIATDCDDQNPAISPIAPELCDGLDNDCSGAADFQLGPNDFEDDDGDGLVDAQCVLGNDCDDQNPLSGPGGIEQCDGFDNDCDGIVDENAINAVWYSDLDGDGFGAAQSGVVISCTAPGTGFTTSGGDCDDADPDRFPTHTETCNNKDDDCDASVDEETDFETDAANCGLCGFTCDTTEAALSLTGVCSAGACECVPNFGDCDFNAANGCEQDLRSQINHCGECGNFCDFPGGLAECVNGSCQYECLPTHTSCGSDPLACETPLGTLTDCTSCGDNCIADSDVNGTPLCLLFGCYTDCNHGFANCNADPRTCETNILDDDQNCGGCSLVCGSGTTCQNGTCVAGTPGPGGGSGTAAQIIVGADFSCALEISGAVFCWGDNTHGQLGDGSQTSRENAAPVINLPAAVRLYGGAQHACAATSMGQLYCWGNNDQGQTGAITIGSPTLTPQVVPSLQVLTNPGRVALGRSHSCAVNSLGSIQCWGGNARGQLGRGHTNVPSTPHVPGSLSNQPSSVGTLRAGAEFTCVEDVGIVGVVCWGANDNGQIGTVPPSGTPITAPLTTVTGVTTQGVWAAGTAFACNQPVSQAVKCWGQDSSLQLGNDSMAEDSNVPLNSQFVIEADQIAAFHEHVCGLSNSGNLLCWGKNSSGELGVNGYSAPIPSPVQVTFAQPTIISSIPVSGVDARHTCAIDNSNKIWCWGLNENLQLGQPPGTDSNPTPTQVPLP